MPSAAVLLLVALLVLVCPLAAAAQPPAEGEKTEEPSTAAEEEEATGDVGEPPPPESEALVPELDVYFPEGELDIRLNRLVKKVFAEGQVKYNFVDGDISAFLRYRYYGYARTYQLSVFDEIEFEDIEDFSNDFDRVRGILLLTEWPHSYHHRTFLLTELDRITSNKGELVFDTGRSNLFLRFGYQIGTPHDERSNAIVGENRARVERLFTAFRQIGPGDAGLTGALTWGTDVAVGDFKYVKLEVSGLKRFELPRGFALFSRIHGGTFPLKDELDREIAPGSDLPVTGIYAIPREEFFRLDGRDNLKGLDEPRRGTSEVHGTLELVYPWFVGEDYERLWVQWENWYWVLYGGAGTIGFESERLIDPGYEFGDMVYDVGIGFEASFRLKDYEFFLSGLAAQAFNAEGDVQLRLSLKSYH